MNIYIKQNWVRFLVTNIVLMLLSYYFFLNINSAMPGSVDKSTNALQITGLFLLLLNTSFVSTGLIFFAFKMKKVPLYAILSLELVVFVALFWIAYIIL
jgi:hypothetical protein